MQLVCHLPGQREQVAGGCVPGQAGPGEGQLRGRERPSDGLRPGVQAITPPRRLQAYAMGTALRWLSGYAGRPGIAMSAASCEGHRAYLQPGPGFLPVATDAPLSQAEELETQVGQGERQEGQLEEREIRDDVSPVNVWEA